MAAIRHLGFVGGGRGTTNRNCKKFVVISVISTWTFCLHGWKSNSGTKISVFGVRLPKLRGTWFRPAKGTSLRPMTRFEPPLINIGCSMYYVCSPALLIVVNLGNFRQDNCSGSAQMQHTCVQLYILHWYHSLSNIHNTSINKHPSRVGHPSHAPMQCRSRNSKFHFLQVVSPDPQNTCAKFHRRRPSGLEALGFWICWHRTDRWTDA